MRGVKVESRLMGEQLVCYAPGDGALAFSYTEERFHLGEASFTQISTCRPVQRADIEEYLKNKGEKFQSYLIIHMGEPCIREETMQVEVKIPVGKKRGRPSKKRKPVYEEKTIFVLVPPMYRLCAPVFRIAPDKVQLEDTIYTYSVDEENTFWKRDQEYTDFNLSIQYHRYLESDDEVLIDEDREVRNVSTRAAIKWFLNNEARIVQQYPEQDKTTIENVAQLREAAQNLKRAGMPEEQIHHLVDQ